MFHKNKYAKKAGILDKLTIGLDYGFNSSCLLNFAIWSGLAEKSFNFNFVAMGKELLTQSQVDWYKSRNIKVMPYSYNPQDGVPYENIYAYLIDY